MTFYIRSQNTADRLISKFGANVTITKKTNTGDAWDPTQTLTTQTVKAAVLNFNKSNVDGTLVLADDKLVYITAKDLDFDIEKEHTITINNVNHSIVNLNTFKPADTVVYYEAQARKIG
jgi:hypothetical protein